MEGMGDGTEGMGFEMPMLMNQQPQLFGTYPQDGSPVPSVFQGPNFQDEPAMGTGDDQNDAKRRRIARVRGSRCAIAGCQGREKVAWADRNVFVLGLRYVSEKEDKV